MSNKQLLLPFLVPPGNHKTKAIKKYLSYKCSKCGALLYTDKETLCSKCQKTLEQPKCDCGAKIAKTTCVYWCSTQQQKKDNKND